MAIVQISRIQHRKGLQQDIPQLASAELGWSIDTRQLYIGNGTIAEGAPVEGITEILTQYSNILNIGNQYTFKGAQTGYTSQTGKTSLSPIQRSLQQKLDDIVNVRDFGATGDGSTDDTEAIQRAVDQILFGNFSLSQTKLRRVIHFPAGIYKITAPIALPAYACLSGEGNSRTVIQQISTVPVLQLKDSANQTGTLYATSNASTAKYITVENLTLNNQSTANIVNLDSCNDIDFYRVDFVGSQASSTSTSRDAQNAVYAKPTDATKNISNVRFLECSFTACTQGLILNAYNVKVLGCDFSNMSRAVWVDTTYSDAKTENIKISNCTFDTIGRSAIYVYAPDAVTRTNVFSIGNFFGTVGGADSSPTSPVINFAGGYGNMSVSDAFARSDVDAGAYPRVSHVATGLNLSLSARDGLQTGMIVRGTGRTYTLSASVTNANTGIVVAGTVGGARIDYMLQRAGSSAYRTGFIQVIQSGTNVQYTDEYVEYPNATTFTYPGPTGVAFKASSISSSAVGIYYTSDSSGIGTLTYSITKFQL